MEMVARGVAWIPVATAAKLLKVSRQRVYALIESGRLSSKTLDQTVLVSQESVLGRLQAQKLLPGTE